MVGGGGVGGEMGGVMGCDGGGGFEISLLRETGAGRLPQSPQGSKRVKDVCAPAPPPPPRPRSGVLQKNKNKNKKTSLGVLQACGARA